ncbi:MAG: hypothetical protein EXS13_01510 [Planctomycetes bacterium]|nr:hypothetical protein [Planctomycetota bacterium]
MSAIGQANALLGNVAKIGFVVVSGVAVWLGIELKDGGERRTRELSQKSAEVDRLKGELGAASAENSRLAGDNVRLAAEVATKQKEIERLVLAQKLLKVERRVARLVVLEQSKEKAAGVTRTRVRFQELDSDSAPIGEPIEATLDGEQVYVDAQVVKFEDALVEAGDPLRGSSLVLFRRLFGEAQAPSSGVALDVDGARPRAYGGNDPGGGGGDNVESLSELEREVWQRFWQLAHDPKLAATLGVRAAHGEAPSMKVRTGEVYRLTLRASGGLTFEVDRPSSGGQ